MTAAPTDKLPRTLTDRISRRTLTGAAAVGAGLPLLAACGGDSDSGTDAGGASTPSSSPSADASSSAPSETAGSSAAAEGLTSTADIEVGGGTVFADQEVVITQPTEGEFKCFSAVCTHQGCLVSDVSDGAINCECHGSKFDISTGEPTEGPATSPLGEEQITVSGDQIVLG